MIDKYEARRTTHREKYEAPQAIHLNDADRAYGQCIGGSTPIPANGYREHGFEGVCVTGKDAQSGCYAGVGGCVSGSSVV